MENNYDDEMDTIERCPHDSENPYTMISNALTRDSTISPNCRWLITYLLSNEKTWKINIKQVVNHLSPHMCKKSVYNIVDEALESGYLKREEKFNGNLRNGYKYTVSETPKFKKCLRSSVSRDAGSREAEKGYIKKEQENNEQTKNHHQEPEGGGGYVIEKKDDDDVFFNDKEREDLNNYTPEEVEQALKILKDKCHQSHNSSRVRFFFTTIRNLRKSPKKPNLEPIEEIKKHFKKGERYNQAIFDYDSNAVAFSRGIHQNQVDLKYFSWDKFHKLCEEFGIEFKR